MTRPRLAAAPTRCLGLAVVVTLALVGAGCSSESTTGSGATATTVAGYQIVPDAVVTAGLHQVENLSDTLATDLSANQTKAKATVATIYELWSGFEGTIKANAVASYLDMEDAMGKMKAGVDAGTTAEVQTGSATFAAAADKYRLTWPGTTTPPSVSTPTP